MLARIRIMEQRREIVCHTTGPMTLHSAGTTREITSGTVRFQLVKQMPATGNWWFKGMMAADPADFLLLQDRCEQIKVNFKIIPFGTEQQWPGAQTDGVQLLVLHPFSDRSMRQQHFQHLKALQDILEFQSSDDIIFLPETPAASVYSIDDGQGSETVTEEIRLTSREPIRVEDVRIGINFHWDHHQEISYPGNIRVFVMHDGLLGVASDVDVELYLASVNSSEMTADSPAALLEAQTIAARSTFYATRGRHHAGEPFDLCSDDHCQCYHGLSGIEPASQAAAEATRGQVLVFGGEICDSRYSKSCGGIVEAYENVWENRSIAYMPSFPDGDRSVPFPANSEASARAFIDGNWQSWCNTEMTQLPEHLQYADHYFRWTVELERDKLAARVNERTGADFQVIHDLIPLERGDSGRIIRLKIVGDSGEIVVGKELKIRRVLSETHLFSACFYVVHTDAGFLLRGAGWGHGVGMCQLGATAMAQKGHTTRKILSHYYPHTQLVQLTEEG